MPTSRSQSLGPSAQDGRRALAGGNAEEDAESRVGVCDPAMGAGISKVVTAVSEDAEGTPRDGRVHGRDVIGADQRSPEPAKLAVLER